MQRAFWITTVSPADAAEAGQEFGFQAGLAVNFPPHLFLRGADLHRCSRSCSWRSPSGCSAGWTTRSRTGSSDGHVDRGRERLQAVLDALPADPQAGRGREAPRPEDQGRLLGAPGRDLRGRAGRGDRADGAQRLRQEHAAQAHHGRDEADLGPGPHPRPDLRPDRHRRRVPSRDDRHREHLHERRHPRHDQGGDGREVRRHRRLRGRRRVHGHPGRQLLLGHVRPARLLRGRATSTATSSSPTRCWRSATSRSRRSA